MKRTASEQLLAWKNDPARKPLVLKGVRQCGKTYILKEFGEAAFPDVAYFNFEETPRLADLFEKDADVDRIVTELGLFRGKEIVPGGTLLILDEIQECGKALTSLKYFCEKKRELAVACAGSLLGIAIGRERSFPVGKVDFLTLYPMSFREFLAATEGDALADFIASFKAGNELSAPVAEKLAGALQNYYVVGGMPEVVETWRVSRSVEKVENAQQQILSAYELDFVKHASPGEFPKLSAVWGSIPRQLAKPNSKFVFSHVKTGWRAKDLEDALQWLVRSGLVCMVKKIERPYFPLSAYADATAFKLYLSDVGLLRRLAKVPPRVVLDPSPFYTDFKGAMTENFVLNELTRSGCEEPFYWNSGNQAEVDFVIQKNGQIVPIEVKSSESVKARSLTEYRKKYEPKYAVVTSMKSDTGGSSVLNIPLYLISSLGGFIA